MAEMVYQLSAPEAPRSRPATSDHCHLDRLSTCPSTLAAVPATTIAAAATAAAAYLPAEAEAAAAAA